MEDSGVSNKRKTFLIRKRLPDDQLKLSKNMSVLPGLQNYLMAPNASGTFGVFKPASRGEKKKPLNTSASQKLPQRQSEVFDQSEHLSEVGERVEEHLINGPQLKMKKEFISFNSVTGQVGYDNLLVFNNGSAAIYYEWKRLESVRSQPNSIQDIAEERFFCHHEQNVIKPGERIRFVFSFLSKVTGVFNEEWIIKCEPPCLEQLPTLKLTGQAFVDDSQIRQREEFQKQVKDGFSLKVAKEIIKDAFSGVRTPPPEPADLNDPEQFKIEFEELNLQHQLWYSPEIRNLLESSQIELNDNLNQQHVFNGQVQTLYEQLQHVEEDEEKELIQRKLDLWVKLARKVPIARNPLYPIVKDLLYDVVGKIPQAAADLRSELGMWEYTFKEPSNEDLTEQQTKAKNDEFNKMKAEWLKKAKKKKWNDELEKELIEEYRNKLSANVSNSILDVATIIENDGSLLSVGALMNPEWKWNIFRRTRVSQNYWDELLRKKTIQDADIEGKKVALKVHLELANRPDVLVLKQQFEDALRREEEEDKKRQEEERLAQEKLALENAKKKKGKVQQKKQEEEVVVQKPKVRTLTHIDPQCLSEIVDIVKHLIDRQAKIVVLLVSYDQPTGKYDLARSTKFFQEWLQQQVECPTYFSSAIIENLDELLESQTYQENSIVVLENLFFYEEELCQFQEEPDIENMTEYRVKMPYGQIYIQGDRVNFFSKVYSSIIHFTSDLNILSNAIAKDIQTVSYNLQNSDRITVILGGALTGDKLLAIDQLCGHVANIILLGKLGLAFYVTMYDIKSDLISDSVRKVIKNLLATLQGESREKPPQRLTRISHIQQQLKPKARLLCPSDFLITEVPQDYSPSNPEHLQQVLSTLKPFVPTGTLDLPEGHALLDYGPQTIETVMEIISDSQRLLWIDSANLSMIEIDKQITVPDLEAIALLKKLKEEEAIREAERLEKLKDKKGKQSKKVVEAPKEEINIKTTKEILVPVFNETNRSLGKMLYEMQQLKQTRHQQAQRDGSYPVYDFSQDCVVTCIGSALEDYLNQEDFEAKEQVVVPEEEEEVEPSVKDSQQQSEQLEVVEEKVKVNQAKLISDFQIQDQDFILKVLSGERIHGQFDEYPPKPESEINEEQYFEDDD